MAVNEFVTRSYYYDDYPQWVTDWNGQKLPEHYSGTSWKLMPPIDSYLFGHSDDPDWETELAGYGRTLPHAFSTVDDPYFSTFLVISPAGDELTTSFTKTLIVLSSDHGSPESAGYLATLGIPTGYVSPGGDKDPAIARVKSKFGITSKLIERYDHPYLYLTNEVVGDPGIDLFALEAEIAKELVTFSKVFAAIPSTVLETDAYVDNSSLGG
ncbi:MAG: hypothetical protein ACI9BH_001246 [Paracoccaceae bacterium]|jgi:hypothetical protein